VEPTTPCATKKNEEEKVVNQQVINGRIIFPRCGPIVEVQLQQVEVKFLHRVAVVVKQIS
jgi:hypothetical protein